MSLKPLNDRIIVEPSEAETRTASGLVLPDSAQEKPQKGKVLAVGPGKRLDNGTLAKPDVSVGDMVLYGKYSGTEVKLSGKEYVILRAEDVLGILVGEKSAARAPVAKSSKANSPAKQRPAKSKVAAKPKAAKATPKAKTAKAKPAKSKAMKTAPKTKAIKTKPAKKAVPQAKPTKKGKK